VTVRHPPGHRGLVRLEWLTGALALVGGLLLVAFEATEFAWLGFQPLQLVFAVVGATVMVLSVQR